MAGPIVRAREFLPQLETPRDPRDIPGGAAMWLIAIGLIKKVAIADYLAREVVDPVFAVPEAYSAPDVDLRHLRVRRADLLRLLGLHRHGDRPRRCSWASSSRTTSTARTARASFREFWRRWHITLSRFLRDFLYIPFGGSRAGS